MRAGFPALGAGAFLIDFLAKREVEKRIRKGEERTLPGGRLLLRRVYNKGAAGNILEGHPKAVRDISFLLGVLLLARLLYLSAGKGRFAETAGTALFAGGAWSNICDRAAKGQVVDYLAFFSKRRQRFSRLTFNLSDLFILAGAALAAAGKISGR